MGDEILAKNAALEERTREAEEANRAKSMFLANMSHEIRTPMNAILGFCHLALRTDMTPRQQDYVSKINGAGVSLLRLINDILDFSKNEAGKLARTPPLQPEGVHRQSAATGRGQRPDARRFDAGGDFARRAQNAGGR
jgi:signal transduction histidine kinase